MEDGLLEGWALFVWRWRWRRHLAWLSACAVRAQERSFAGPGYGDACPCSRRRPGALMAVHLRDLERIEGEMRHVIHYD